MPDSLGQLFGGSSPVDSPTAAAPQSLGQLMGGATPAPQASGNTPSAYFAAHPGMDPLAVDEAFRLNAAQQFAHQYAQKSGMDEVAVRQAVGAGPAAPYTPEQAQHNIDIQNRAEQGIAGNAMAGALANYTGLGGQLEEGAARLASTAGLNNAAENLHLAAMRSFDTAPQSGSIAGIAGQIAGNPMTLLGKANAGPAGQLAAGVSALNQMGLAAHNVDVAREGGQYVSPTAAMTNIGAHGVLDYIASRVAQRGITGDISSAIAPVFKNVIANVASRLAATGAIEGVSGAANQFLNNAIEQVTGVNPNVHLTDDMWHAAAVQSGIGVAGQALHEVPGAVKQARFDRSVSEANQKAAAKFAENKGPTIQPPSGEEPRVRVQGEEHLIAPEPYDTSRAEGKETPATGNFGPGPYEAKPAEQNVLPQPPPESKSWTNEQLQKWASENGYDLSGVTPGLGKRPVAGEMERQRGISADVEAANRRQPFVQPPTLPDSVESMDVGQLRKFATDNGIKVPGIIELRRLAESGGIKPREALVNYLRDVTSTGAAAPEQPKPAVAQVPNLPEQVRQQMGTDKLADLRDQFKAESARTDALIERANKAAQPTLHLPSDEHANVVKEMAGGDVVDPNTLHESHREVLAIGRELTGRDFVPYQGGKGRGFYMDGATYYNVGRNLTESAKREAIAHEATHWLQDARPELIKPIADAIPKAYGDKLIAEYEKAYESQEGHKLPEQLRQRELEAFVVGKAFARPSVMRAVMQENPNAFMRAADAVMEKLRSLTAGGRLTNQIIDSLRQARDEVKVAAGEGNAATAETSYLPEKEPDRRLPPMPGLGLNKQPGSSGLRPVPRVGPSMEKLPQDKGAFKSFVDSDVRNAADAVGSVYRGIQNLFGRQAGEEAHIARGIWRHRGAELQHRYDQLHTALDATARHVDRDFSKDDMHAAQDAWESGRSQPRQEIQQAVDAIKAAQEERWQRINQLDPGGIGYIENYYKHQFRDPDKASDVMAQLAAKKPLGGDAGFRKQRGIPTMAEARVRGLEAAEPNPIRNGILAIHNMDKYVTALESRDEMTKNGLLKDAPQQGTPEGWQKINDPIFKGRIAPAPVASLVNNMLDPGLTSSPRFGRLARVTLGAGNVANMLQLGLNLYHVAKTSWEAIKSEGAQGTRSLLSIPGNLKEGEYQQAAANAVKAGSKYLLAGSGFGPIVRDFMEGSRIRKEWLTPGSTDPETAAMVAMLKEAGHRAVPDTSYRTGFAEAMAQAWRDNNQIGAALRLPFAAMEKLTAPILHQYVPRIKNGVAAEMVRQELADLGKNPDINDLRGAMGVAINSVDNRFGMMVNDNLFWHRSVRDVGHLLVRALSYQTGTAREFGGAAKDVLTAGAQAVRGKGEVTDTLRSNRLAYAVTSPVMSMIAGGMATYLLTGHGPKQMLDYFYPDTGKKDADGQPIRLKLPNYENDLYSFATNPAQTIRNKESGLVGIASGLASNKDYRGVRISDESPLSPKGISDRMLWAAKEMEPIASQNTRRMLGEGEGIKAFLPEVGITQAGRGLDWSAAERVGHDILAGESAEGGRSEEQAERSDLASQLAERIRNGDPAAGAELAEAVSKGKIPPGQIDSLMRRATGPQGIEGVVSRIRNPDDLMRVWAKMTADERRRTAGTIVERVVDATAIAEDKRQAYLSQISDDLKGEK